MLKLEQLKPDLVVRGLLTNRNVKILYVQRSADSATITYEYDGDQGKQLAQAVVHRDQEKDFTEVTDQLTYGGDPEMFKLALEARRIKWAYLFDPMMAVNSSVVTPLPHQITAVYEAMLPKQPLRFLLADDPGAGKTIMAGLLIKELCMRADAQRVLIVSPGSLTTQWQDELREKFSLEFDIFSKEKLVGSASGNPFKDSGFWIVRLDQFSRTEPNDYQPLVLDEFWDLVVIDEAHKVAAHYSGNKVNKTNRFKFAERLSQRTRHFLLMTATPHNGKEEDFQLFLSLLDPDRFYGKAKKRLSNDALKDIMRRMVKEDMRQFDGSRLFPDREAHTVPFELSTEEHDLYLAVTDYVRNEMNRAEKLFSNGKKNVVGFALTLLQRRLASSPEAIYRSLERRECRLRALLEDWHQHPEKIEQYRKEWLGRKFDEEEAFDEDDLPAEEAENLDEELTLNATAAKSVAELAMELMILEGLTEQARAVCLSDNDSKWRSLSELLQSKAPDGAPLMDNKLIIFTEHKDTLDYLKKKISALCGNDKAVVVIHGGVVRDERMEIQNAFRHDPEVRYLVATDAAGEGINLQNTNYMINYDLPWNPNRIEQRFGRIHRIGQKEVCHLWNLVAKDTREGQVFTRLLEKLRQQKQDLGDRVFDVLGELFDSMSLKDVLIDSIRDDGEKKKHFLMDRIDMAMERRHIEEVISKNALCKSDFGGDNLLQVKQKMDEAEAKRLQPCYVSAFFENAFRFLNGTYMPKEKGRFQIKQIPITLRNYQAETRSGLKIRDIIPRSYERVCFDKDRIDLSTEIKKYPRAEFLHPGHPLMQAIIAKTLESCQDVINLGAILVDDLDDLTDKPRILSLVDLGAKESNAEQRYAARQMLFLTTNCEGKVVDAGPAPHLDLRPMTTEERGLVKPLLSDLTSVKNENEAVMAEAVRRNEAFFREILQSRKERVELEKSQIEERLSDAIKKNNAKRVQLKMRTHPKPTDAANIKKLQLQINELTSRKERRLAQLTSEEKLLSMAPVICGSALVLPKGLFLKLLGKSVSAVDVAARKRIELCAMKAVTDAEKALGNIVYDCSKENKGWDIESTVPSTGEVRYIEVKGVSHITKEVTVSRNEWLKGHNLGNKFLLAFVVVNGDGYGEPSYIRNPFTNQPDATDTQKSMNIVSLMTIAKTAGKV